MDEPGMKGNIAYFQNKIVYTQKSDQEKLHLESILGSLGHSLLCFRQAKVLIV